MTNCNDDLLVIRLWVEKLRSGSDYLSTSSSLCAVWGAEQWKDCMSRYTLSFHDERDGKERWGIWRCFSHWLTLGHRMREDAWPKSDSHIPYKHNNKRYHPVPWFKWTFAEPKLETHKIQKHVQLFADMSGSYLLSFCRNGKSPNQRRSHLRHFLCFLLPSINLLSNCICPLLGWRMCRLGPQFERSTRQGVVIGLVIRLNLV